mgnify:FL=1
MKEKKNTVTKPTDAEMEILKVLWDNGPNTVRFVNDKLNERKDVGYTTTLKIMQIMFDKGMVERIREGRTHVYTPLVSETEVQQKVLDRLLETTFGGSAKKLVMSALGRNRSSKEELEEIRKLIDKLESEQ